MIYSTIWELDVTNAYNDRQTINSHFDRIWREVRNILSYFKSVGLNYDFIHFLEYFFSTKNNNLCHLLPEEVTNCVEVTAKRDDKLTRWYNAYTRTHSHICFTNE